MPEIKTAPVQPQNKKDNATQVNHRISIMTKDRKFRQFQYETNNVNVLKKIFERLGCNHIKDYTFEHFGDRTGRYPNFEYENERCYDYRSGCRISDNYKDDKIITLERILSLEQDEELNNFRKKN